MSEMTAIFTTGQTLTTLCDTGVLWVKLSRAISTVYWVDMLGYFRRRSALNRIKEDLPGLQRRYWGEELPDVVTDLVHLRNEPVRERRIKPILRFFDRGGPVFERQALTAYYVLVDQMPRGPAAFQMDGFRRDDPFWHEPDRTWIVFNGTKHYMWSHDSCRFYTYHRAPYLTKELVAQAVRSRVSIEEVRIGEAFRHERVVECLVQELGYAKEDAQATLVELLQGGVEEEDEEAVPQQETLWQQLDME